MFFSFIKNVFSSCGQYVISNKSVCSWDYDGSGVQYQVLAGPAFIAVFTISGIIIGTLGDIYNRLVEFYQMT